jgi:hypothetical protein
VNKFKALFVLQQQFLFVGGLLFNDTILFFSLRTKGAFFVNMKRMRHDEHSKKVLYFSLAACTYNARRNICEMKKKDEKMCTDGLIFFFFL